MDDVIESEGLRLAAHHARPTTVLGGGATRRALVICHSFPAGADQAASSGRTLPELADRIAADVGWSALTFNFRGTGTSEGEFSLGGWLADVRAAVDHLHASGEVDEVWVCGTSTGGALAVCEAGEDERVRGVAVLGARADFDDWAAHPRRFLQHAREAGAIRSPTFPPDVDAWARELREIRPLALAAKLAPRPLLVVHGSEDEIVPVTDARALADCHGSADLRIVTGAGHRLRHDPRAIAILLGWMERQTSDAP